MSIYHYSAVAMNGKDKSLREYKGKVVLIVNTAGRCGFTYQYKDLQRLYDRYKDKGFVILGFPCNQFDHQEPDSNDQIQTSCMLNYGVSFPLFQKTDVRGNDAHPLFNYLTGQKNFKGFNEMHPVSKILLPLINEKHPEYLSDNYSIKWNFTKFLIDPEGNVVDRFECTTDPIDIERDIESLLQQVTA
ncbi:glutathione peroxidase [Evansella cellulosilytica]|uniref:Glutathione peroxidase n=1 Tax=Evansella cellulosilytica (strain ATCC 21833 / DSM 2522 / FERM P-1141 / JCM 9156 / N-4) TaxID=649639 RepID=E6TU94_EVAC2|nr:glutathione peroxidase [Evansella cellulosilytica]ADU28554.1 Peroxiredoxin [Evansella cellulosilytica DSM 2522]